MSEKKRAEIARARKKKEEKIFARGTYLLYASVLAEIILITSFIK